MALNLSIKLSFNTRSVDKTIDCYDWRRSYETRRDWERVDKQMNMMLNQKNVDDFPTEITYAKLEYSDHCHQTHLKKYRAEDHFPQFFVKQVKLHSPTPTPLQLSPEYFLKIILLFQRRANDQFSSENPMDCRNTTYRREFVRHKSSVVVTEDSIKSL